MSAVITYHGTASLILLPADTTLTGKGYLEILKRDHIPAVRHHFQTNDFTWIHVAKPRHDFDCLYVACADQVMYSLVAMASVGQRVNSHRCYC